MKFIGLISRGLKPARSTADSVQYLDGQTVLANAADTPTAAENSHTNIVFAINDDNFETILGNTKYDSVVIEFGDASDESCKRMGPIVRQLATENAGILFLKVSTVLCPKTAESYETAGPPLPKFVFRKNKYEVGRIAGTGKEQVGKFIEENRPTYTAVEPAVQGKEIRIAGDGSLVAVLVEINRTKQGERKLTVMYFSAPWCRTYSRMLSFVQEQADKGGVTMLVVDVDQCPRAASNYRIRILPTFVYQKYNTMVDTFEGDDRAEIKSRIDTIREGNVAICVSGDTNFRYRLEEAKDGSVLVCFYKAACYEHNLAIQACARAFPDVTFLKAYEQMCPAITRDYKIVGDTPTFVFQKYREEMGRFYGDDNEGLRAFIRKYKDTPSNKT